MKSVIYALGSLFLGIAILMIYLGISSFFKGDPYQLSAVEFKKLYNNQEAYSYTYFGDNNRNIFICLDKSFSKKEDTRMPKCNGHRRYIKTAELDETTKAQIIEENKPTSN